MKARSKSSSRNILRIFEIALFFAISVLGYGLLAKTTSAGSKSKTRTHPTDVRNSLGYGEAEPENHPSSIALPRTALNRQEHPDRTGPQHSPVAAAVFQHARHPFTTCPPCTSARLTPLAIHHLPCNLLQENPVLLL